MTKAAKPQDLLKALRVKPDKTIDLSDYDPGDTSLFGGDKDGAREQLKDDAEAISKLQGRLYAERTRALLVVLQGIDTSGKDGTVRAVFNAAWARSASRSRRFRGRPRRSWRMISSGACTQGLSAAAARSASSTARITRTCSSAGCASSPTREGHRASLRPDQRLRGHDRVSSTKHPEIHAAHLEGRAKASACNQGSTRRASQEVEVQSGRSRGAGASGTSYMDAYQDRSCRRCSTKVGALVHRDPERPQMGPQCSRRVHRATDARGHGSGISEARLGSGRDQDHMRRGGDVTDLMIVGGGAVGLDADLARQARQEAAHA